MADFQPGRICYFQEQSMRLNMKKNPNGLSILIRGVNHSQTRHHNYDNKILPTEGLNPFLSDRRFFCISFKTLRMLVLSAYTNSECSDESTHPCSLVKTFTTRIIEVGTHM